jgi:transcriptional regulator with XRE-family HTH domain
MYHLHSPRGWDQQSRVMSNSVEVLRKDAAFVPEVRSPTVRRRELGALLRALRNQNGLTVDQVAERLLCSPSKVSRMETGHGAATPRDIRDLCDLYAVTEGERERMMRLAHESKQQGWWHSHDLDFGTYVGLEEDATATRCYQSTIVPGVLQTADYARAVHEVVLPRLLPDRIEELVEVRMIRQRRLTQDNPPRFTAVLDEAALHRMVGGHRVMAAQLDKILEMSAMPNIAVQILPYQLGAHPAMESNFIIVELPLPTPGVVFVEGLIGSLYLERSDDLDRYHTVFEQLQAIALNPKDTIDLIASLARSYKDSLEAALRVN